MRLGARVTIAAVTSACSDLIEKKNICIRKSVSHYMATLAIRKESAIEQK